MRDVKIPRLKGGSLGPSTESCINCYAFISMVWCLHQGNIYIKRKLRVWRDQKYIPLVGGITPLNCAGRHNTPSRGRQYRAQNGKFVKLERTYGHGTVFAPRTESCINCDGIISMVPCLHQGNIYNKRKLRVWRDQI